MIIRSVIVRLASPENLRGRIASVNWLFVGASNEIGAFESGVAARLFGVVPSVAIGGVVTLVVVALVAFATPELRQLDLRRPIVYARVRVAAVSPPSGLCPPSGLSRRPASPRRAALHRRAARPHQLAAVDADRVARHPVGERRRTAPRARRPRPPAASCGRPGCAPTATAMQVLVARDAPQRRRVGDAGADRVDGDAAAASAPAPAGGRAPPARPWRRSPRRRSGPRAWRPRWSSRRRGCRRRSRPGVEEVAHPVDERVGHHVDGHLELLLGELAAARPRLRRRTASSRTPASAATRR